MAQFQIAVYARVSCEQQVEAETISSQLSDLRDRVEQDGLKLSPELTFIDDGYSGANLLRPGLERLRDVVAMHGIDKLYVHSPDRLARKYAYQFLLIDEFQRAGVDTIFLNCGLNKSPEDDLLLQVQGIIAEYERAKIMERSRRGKRYAAGAGKISVLTGAPFGYRYVTKHEGGGQAHYEIVPDQAKVVRQIFHWIGYMRTSIGEVCRRLKQAGELTSTGKKNWDRSTVRGILKNPAYKGNAAYGKTRAVPMQPKLRTRRGSPLQPRWPKSVEGVPEDQWIFIPVPAIVGEDLFEMVQMQLEENRQHARQQKHGASYLLQGLVVCSKCGYGYYGKSVEFQNVNGKHRFYTYYRCRGTNSNHFGGERICYNKSIRADMLDSFVWDEVCHLLDDPRRIEREYQRRLTSSSRENEDLVMAQTQMAKLRQGIGRLIDSYAEGIIAKEEFEPRVQRMKQRLDLLEEKIEGIRTLLNQQNELRQLITCLEDFAAKVREGLTGADWISKRNLIRTLVKQVEVGEKEVNVIFRVAPVPFDPSLNPWKFLQHWLRREYISPGQRPGKTVQCVLSPERAKYRREDLQLLHCNVV